MMDYRPRKILKDLIGLYGISLAADPLRTEGLLRDMCGSNHREIFVLVNAIRQKIPADLLAPRHSLSLILLQDFLAKRLRDELSLSDDASHWAVESWVEALGLAPETPVPENPERVIVLPVGAGSSTPVKDPVSLARRQQWADNLESIALDTRLQTVQDLLHTPDPENIQLLIGALDNGNWQVRERAYDALSALGEVAIPGLCEALSDTNEGIVWRASLLIGSLKAKEAIGKLILLLGCEGIIRECAIWSLGEIGDDRASTALLIFINTDNPVVQQEVETALAKIGNTPRGKPS
jgi:hypothetical protein